MGYITDPSVIKVEPSGAVADELDAHKADAASDDVHGLLSGGRVVEESGNNTDGYYVRWSDGTQICQKAYFNMETVSGLNNEIIEGYWTFPKPFLDISFSQSANLYLPDQWAATPGRREVLSPGFLNKGTNGIQFRVFAVTGVSFQPGDLVQVNLIAVGQWK